MITRSLFTLVLTLLAGPANAYSTEGCKGRKDPYKGRPPQPTGLITKGTLGKQLTPLSKHLRTFKSQLKYSTPDNIVGRALYPKGAQCWVRPELGKALAKAARHLAQGGFGLIVYDCYRPWSVQVQLWQACPRRGLVGDPARGSHHNRGAAVDVGIYRLHDDHILAMPSAFDDLSKRARHSYQGGTAQEREHRRWLAVTMRRAGLRPIASEWWHYQLRGASRFAPLDLALKGVSGTAP